MSESDERSWLELQGLWQQDSAHRPDDELRRLARRVRRRSRALRWLAAAEIVAAVAFTLLAVSLLRTHGGIFGWVTFGAVLGFVLAATAFSWWNRRGTWSAAGEHPADYLVLERRQLDARLRALGFAWGLLVSEVVFFLFWIPWSGSPRLGVGYAFLAGWSALFALILHGLRRRTWSQRRALERLREELRSDALDGAP